MMDKLIHVLRSMAWERAKGELFSILDTYYGDEREKFEKMNNKLTKFVKEIEDEGLSE